MTIQSSTVQVQMTMYGGALGFFGGGLLGAGFIALTYNPFFELNILLIAIGTLATMLAGLTFGVIAGGISGIGVAILTKIFSYYPHLRQLYRVSAIGFSMSVALYLCFHMGFLIGQPYIFDTATYPSWLWALVLSAMGAVIVSVIVTQSIVNQYQVKLKPVHTK